MRIIDWESPLSEDDKAWLRDRDRHAEIEAHEAKWVADGEPAGDETTDDYDKWTKAELVAEAEGRKPAVDPSGNKSDIIAALRAWDVDHPDAE